MPVRPPLSGHAGVARNAARWVLAIGYAAAGVLHILTPDVFLSITPGWVPFPRAVVLGTGICEIAGAGALLTRRLRGAAGIALALYAVCVFPANIKHAIDAQLYGAAPVSLWYHIPRLALQPILVWWALFAGEVVRWPFHHRV